MKKRICLIGLNAEMSQTIRQQYLGPVLHHDTVPKMIVKDSQLYVERRNGVGLLPVDKVVFHGIYENDLDFITGLSIWGGPCFPDAHAMMNCRLKLPCLARALRISRFGSTRGFITSQTSINTDDEIVAKWGNWHCGENKHRFTGSWQSGEAAVLEPFFVGQAVRVVIVGDYQRQIRLTGKTWLKSIHDDQADFIELDAELLADTLQIKQQMGMDLIANDYIVGDDGRKHLLEVNHIPNVTRFQPLQEAYLATVIDWLHKDESNN